MRSDPIWVQVVVEGWHYGARALRAGELVQMTPLDAAKAHREGWISLTRPAAAAIAAASVRTAEPPPVFSRALEAEPARAPEPERSKRRYRRRDLEPEQ